MKFISSTSYQKIRKTVEKIKFTINFPIAVAKYENMSKFTYFYSINIYICIILRLKS